MPQACQRCGRCLCLLALSCACSAGDSSSASQPALDAALSDAGRDSGPRPRRMPVLSTPADAHRAAPPRTDPCGTWFNDSGGGDDLTLHPDGGLIASDPIGEGSYSAPTGRRRSGGCPQRPVCHQLLGAPHLADRCARAAKTAPVYPQRSTPPMASRPAPTVEPCMCSSCWVACAPFPS